MGVSLTYLPHLPLPVFPHLPVLPHLPAFSTANRIPFRLPIRVTVADDARTLPRAVDYRFRVWHFRGRVAWRVLRAKAVRAIWVGLAIDASRSVGWVCPSPAFRMSLTSTTPRFPFRLPIPEPTMLELSRAL